MNRCARGLRLFVRLGVASVALLCAGCPDDSGVCAGEESVVVKMTGTCASGERTFEIHRAFCGITLQPLVANADAGADADAGGAGGAGDGGSPAPFGLPTRGAVGRNRAPIRQGGWEVWGCLTGSEPCPDAFRLCTADRTAFQLNLTCLDGTGAAACEAVLTE